MDREMARETANADRATAAQQLKTAIKQVLVSTKTLGRYDDIAADKRTAVYSPPTLTHWQRKSSGRIHGNVKGHPQHENGTRISVKPAPLISNDIFLERYLLLTKGTHNYRLGKPSIPSGTIGTDGHNVKDSTSRCSFNNPCPPSTTKMAENQALYSPPTISPTDKDAVPTAPSRPPNPAGTAEEQNAVSHTLKQATPFVFQLIVEHPWNNMSHHEEDVRHDWLVKQIRAVKQGKQDPRFTCAPLAWLRKHKAWAMYEAALDNNLRHDVGQDRYSMKNQYRTPSDDFAEETVLTSSVDLTVSKATLLLLM